MNDTLAPTVQTYTVDPAHAHVRFWVRHLMISKVHGEFGAPTGTVRGVPGDPTSAQVEISIPVGTVDTGNADRDAHLRSADFFDAETYPTMTYRSSSVRALGDGEYEIQGELTLHGVTAPITLRAEISDEVPSPFGGTKIGVSATGKLDRETFGLVWNMALESGGVVVGKDVHLQIDAELDRPA